MRMMSFALAIVLFLGPVTLVAAQSPPPQPPVTDVSQLPAVLVPGDRLRVTQADREIEGRLLELAPNHMTLRLEQQEIQVPIDRIRAIARVRSRARGGTVVGLLVGAGAVLAMVAISRVTCGDNCELDVTGGEIAAATGLYAAAGAGAGALIGLSMRRTDMMYVAAPGTGDRSRPRPAATLGFSIRF